MEKEDQEFIDKVKILDKVLPNWRQLPTPELNSKLERITRDSFRVIDRVNSQLDNFTFLMVGVVLGVVGNLWASMIYDLFKNYIFTYFVLLALITCATLYWILHVVVKKMEGHMTNDPWIAELLKEDE